MQSTGLVKQGSLLSLRDISKEVFDFFFNLWAIYEYMFELFVSFDNDFNYFSLVQIYE